MVSAAALKPPSPLSVLAELPRAAWTFAELAAAWPGLVSAPRGDGRPVMVLPGMANDDGSTIAIRRFLRAIGYRVSGWGLGKNRGPRTVGPEGAYLIEQLERIAAEAGRPVTLIGVSLGGIMARLLAHRRPAVVREVITISSPYAGDVRATNLWRVFERMSGEKVDGAIVSAFLREAAQPVPVPATAIWSRSDGLVNGLICRAPDDPGCRAIEVNSGHLSVQFKPAVLRRLAEALARSE